MSSHLNFLYLLSFLVFCSHSASAHYVEYLVANVSSSWTNNPLSCPPQEFSGGSMVRLIYSLQYKDSHFGFGFFSSGNHTSFLLSIFIFNPHYTVGPAVVWSSNRNHPVRENAKLEFTQKGDLILTDADGTLVWSTNTTQRSVQSLKLTEMGNLKLVNTRNHTVWQSYDHPTDVLLLQQDLVDGQELVASVSADNFTEGLFKYYVTSSGVFADYGSTQYYITYYGPGASAFQTTSNVASHVSFQNGSLSLYPAGAEPDKPFQRIPIPPTASLQYIKLDSDGHLRAYGWQPSAIVRVQDLLWQTKVCEYPIVCGDYGICTNSECSCPEVTDEAGTYLRPIDERQPKLGCSTITPLSCDGLQTHKLLHLKGVAHFAQENVMFNNMENCKQACLQDCSCKIAFFKQDINHQDIAICYLRSGITSMIYKEDDGIDYEYSAFIKVPITLDYSKTSSDRPQTKTAHGTKSLLFSLVAFFCFSFILMIIAYSLWRIRKDLKKDETSLNTLPGITTRFSYEELKVATKDFCNKLGEGGFGCIYEGTLTSGKKIAVKCMDQLGNLEGSFVAEVETIGSIHHVNLVRLVGFCVNKSHRLLVYEYMSNGSLEKWIFGKSKVTLDWQTRKSIIQDVAKGLAYLHEECGKKILHLDIKPQNILLDSNFNAKVSDFGLSKLVEKDQSKVMTRMRGTPGYLAPEWLTSMITDKVDVYSFGIVVMEILCGRKNIDFTRPKESMHLLPLLEKKSVSEFYELFDNQCEDMQVHREEATDMMKLAVWCLQSDFSRRPSMQVVLKVLDGGMEIERNLNFCLSTPAMIIDINEGVVVSAPLSSSVLSGPR